MLAVRMAWMSAPGAFSWSKMASVAASTQAVPPLMPASIVTCGTSDDGTVGIETPAEPHAPNTRVATAARPKTLNRPPALRVGACGAETFEEYDGRSIC